MPGSGCSFTLNSLAFALKKFCNPKSNLPHQGLLETSENILTGSYPKEAISLPRTIIAASAAAGSNCFSLFDQRSLKVSNICFGLL